MEPQGNLVLRSVFMGYFIFIQNDGVDPTATRQFYRFVVLHTHVITIGPAIIMKRFYRSSYDHSYLAHIPG